VLTLPAGQARPIMDNHSRMYDPQQGKGMALSTDPEQLEVPPENLPDIYDFVRAVLEEGQMRLLHAVLDCPAREALKAEATVEREGASRSFSLQVGDALILAQRMKTPVYATRRVLEAGALSSGEVEPLFHEDVRRQVETAGRVRQFRQEVIGQALDEEVEQVRLVPKDENVEVSFVKEGKEWVVIQLDMDSYEGICRDAILRHGGEEGPLHANRDGRAFVLTASGGEEAGWVIEIQEKETT